MNDDTPVYQFCIAIGYHALLELRGESYCVGIGDFARTPLGKDGWIHIVDVYDGPMTEGEDARARYRAICKNLRRRLNEGADWRSPRFAETLADLADVIPADVPRDAIIAALAKSNTFERGE